MLVIMPGTVIPGFTSSMALMVSSKRNSSIGARGSRPGFSSSFKISSMVNSPMVSVMYCFLVDLLAQLVLFESGLPMKPAGLSPLLQPHDSSPDAPKNYPADFQHREYVRNPRTAQMILGPIIGTFFNSSAVFKRVRFWPGIQQYFLPAYALKPDTYTSKCLEAVFTSTPTKFTALSTTLSKCILLIWFDLHRAGTVLPQ